MGNPHRANMSRTTKRKQSTFLDLEAGQDDTDYRHTPPKQMKVRQLRSALQDRGLSTSGTKQVLLGRLLDADAADQLPSNTAPAPTSPGTADALAATEASMPNGFDIDAFLSTPVAPNASAPAAAQPGSWDASHPKL